MSAGKLFLSALIADGSVPAFVGYGRIDYLFKASETPVYEFIREFVKDYYEFPTPETIEAHTGETLPSPSEPVPYYYDLMLMRHIDNSLRMSMKEVQELLMPGSKDPMKALQVMTKAVMDLAAQKGLRQVVDFREAFDIVWGDFLAKWQTPDAKPGLSFGWPTLDGMAGGLGRGDVLSFLGRPAAGKTWMMLHTALHGWALAAGKHNPDYDQSRLFISMEMDILPIEQRLAAMHTHIPVKELKTGGLTTKQSTRLKAGLKEIKGYGAPFWVVNGNLAATVEDIWLLARQLNPGAIFIDGGYLLKHPHERDRYKRVAENAELIKSELAPLAPVVVSWQFAKTASKKNAKKGEKVTMDDIGYSDVIAQVSSLAVGFFEEESVSTLVRRRGDILKGRNGEVGSFLTNWNFKAMDFSEVKEQELGELVFL
jgi:replicative DNA helicase